MTTSDFQVSGPQLRSCNRGTSAIHGGRLGRRRVGAAAFFFGLTLAVARCALAAPFVPVDPNQILEKLTPRTGPDWEAIAALRAEAEQRGDCRDCTAEVAARIAERYLALFRAQGDPRL